jgi:hypothetical protein
MRGEIGCVPPADCRPALPIWSVAGQSFRAASQASGRHAVVTHDVRASPSGAGGTCTGLHDTARPQASSKRLSNL